MSSLCPSCAHVNRDGARFCDECGTRLPPSDARPAGAERAVGLRQGTFLFCDLAHSTRLANRLDPEDLRQVFKFFQTAVAAAARRHGGRVIRFVGDGAFISYGCAEANEDAAMMAIDTALDLLQSLQTSAPVPGVSIEARAGIASGAVLMGDRIDEAAVPEEAVIGPVAHLAARLLSEAPIGGVAIADATRKLAGGFFEYRDLGQLALKGFERAERVWLVLGSSAVASRFEAKRGAETGSQLVGRAETLRALSDRWQQARLGRGQTVFVVGEAGVGKSRLARALRDIAARDGATVLDIDNSPRASNTPLYVVGVMLRRVCGIGAGELAAPTRTALPFQGEGSGMGMGFLPSTASREDVARDWLGQLLGAQRIDEGIRYLAPLLNLAAEIAPSAESADRTRERTIDIVVELMQALAAREPLFLLCEDAHWADATTALLIGRLARATAQLPVLMLVTARDDADLAPIALHDAELAAAARIALDALDDAAARSLVEMVAGKMAGDGASVLPAAVVDAIVRRAEGNALFLEEITRTYIEAAGEGNAAGEASRVAAGADALCADVPLTLQTLVQSRLDRWPDLKQIAQAASVLGREFSAALLQALLEGRSDLADGLSRLVERQLLERAIDKAAGLFRFKHALIQDAVYQTLLRSDRQRLHSRAADILAHDLADQPDLAADVLAHHLALARRYDEAVVCRAQASAATAARAAYVESIGHCRSGLSLVDRIESPRTRRQLERQLLTQLAVALAATSGYAAPEVQHAYQLARALCEGEDSEDDPAALFPIVGGLGTFYFVRSELATADELAQECVSLAARAQRPDLLIEANCFRGYTRLYLGRIAEGRAALEACVQLYREHHGERFQYRSAQDPGAAGWSLLAIANWLQGDTRRSEQCVQEALAHAQRLVRPFDLAYVHAWIAMLRNLQRRFDSAAEHAERCREISARHGFNTWLVAALIQGGIAAAARVASAGAIAVMQQALGGYLQSGAEVNAPFYLWGIAVGQRRNGEIDAARATIAQAKARAEATGEIYLRNELLCLGAELEASPARARELLHEAIEAAEASGARIPALRAALLAIGAPESLPSDRLRSAWRALEGASAPIDDDWVSRALDEAILHLAGEREGMAALRSGAALSRI
jgi:predicted ATPase/class 3 adenylate cyclase